MPETTKRPGGAWREDRQGSLSATASEWLPFFFTDTNRLRKKAFIGPAAAVMFVWVLLVEYIGLPIYFIAILVSFCSLVSVYLVYQMCGHRKPWWWLLGAGLLVSGIALFSPVIHWADLYLPVPPTETADKIAMGPIGTFWRYFVRAGLFEELLKSLPVFLALGIGRRLRSPWRERLGVWEPLDGILLGVASAAAFGLIENFFFYGPFHAIAQAAAGTNSLSNEAARSVLLANLSSLIVRSVDFLFGHLAWSGLFGYFIGMAAMRPHSAPRLLATGYLTAAGLHGLWDAADVVNLPLQIVVGLASYITLAQVILKGRKLSPSREQNFATVLTDAIPLAGVERVETQPITREPKAPVLTIAGKHFPLRAGLLLFDNDVPGVEGAAADRVVGEFNVNPKNPGMIGLKNLSRVNWVRQTIGGEEQIVEPGRSVHLAPGSTIHFGPNRPNAVQGKVQ